MRLLIDLDSILYKAVYRCISFGELRDAIDLLGKEKARQWMLSEVYERGLNRTEKQILEMSEYLENQIFGKIEGVELFITTCKKSYRKALDKQYKAKRKKNNYVWLLRNHYMINDGIHSDTLEADDLIAIRAKELGKDSCIIVSMDKDLKQIGGYYWSYYKQLVKDENGEVIYDEDGFEEREYKQTEIDYITNKEAEYLFWEQMLTGDPSDNIKGVYRVGKVGAKKILKDSKNYFISVARTYIEKNQKQDFWNNYLLLKLGIDEKQKQILINKIENNERKRNN